MTNTLGHKALLLAWYADNVVPSAVSSCWVKSQPSQHLHALFAASVAAWLTSRRLARGAPKPERRCFPVRHRWSGARAQAIACAVLSSAVKVR